MNNITIGDIINCRIIALKILGYLQVPKKYRHCITIMMNDLVAFKRVNSQCYKVFNKNMEFLNIILNNPTDEQIKKHSNGKLHIINPVNKQIITDTINIKTLVNPKVELFCGKSIKTLIFDNNFKINDKKLGKFINIKHLRISLSDNFEGSVLKKLENLKILEIIGCGKFGTVNLYDLNITKLWYTGSISKKMVQCILKSDTLVNIYIDPLVYRNYNIVINNAIIGKNIKRVIIKTHKLSKININGFIRTYDNFTKESVLCRNGF